MLVNIKMENNNNIYSNEYAIVMPIDISVEKYDMEAIQRKKVLYEQMQSEAEYAQQVTEQIHQQMREDAVISYNPNINEYGEIEETSKLR